MAVTVTLYAFGVAFFCLAIMMFAMAVYGTHLRRLNDGQGPPWWQINIFILLGAVMVFGCVAAFVAANG